MPSPTFGLSSNLVERFFNIIKHFRAIATRYEKTARNFLAGLHLVCALAWLKLRHALVEREGNPGAGFGAEPLGRLADISSAEFYVELGCSLVVGQGPNEKRRIAVLGQVLADHLEKTRAEPQPLKFRCDIKFENLPAIMQRRHAIASIACIAANGFIEIQDQKARSP